MKKNTIVAVVIIVVVVGAYFLFFKGSSDDQKKVTPNTTDTKTVVAPTKPKVDGDSTVVGTSVKGRNIIAYHYGKGGDEILFVGGIHGSYAWNTGAVAYDLMDYLKANPNAIPANEKITVIPVLNPDGMVVGNGTTSIRSLSEINDVPESVLVSGRFNSNKVDLNRNFDCDWQSTGKWQSKTVSGGSEAFSEPESQAFKNYVEKNKPVAVVAWYSAAGGVYASSCHNGVSAETNKLTKTYSVASGYPAYETFDFYAITGDMINWVAKNNIPAISVLLTNHTSTEWTKNQAGIIAVLKSYAK